VQVGTLATQAPAVATLDEKHSPAAWPVNCGLVHYSCDSDVHLISFPARPFDRAFRVLIVKQDVSGKG
jgi:hypothetical protein